MAIQPFDWLGPTPAEEDCAQSNQPDFSSKNSEECRKYKAMLDKAYPPPNGTCFHIQKSDHDFGPYREVVAMVDEDIANEVEVDGWCSKYNCAPGTWMELEDIAEGRVRH